jgi:hypothetical protein
MKKRSRFAAAAGTALCLSLSFGSSTATPTRLSVPTTVQQKVAMATKASGTFDVKMSPQPQDDKVGDPTVGRMSLEKTFHGDLEGTSKGQMLTGGTDVEGSGVYVAIERVTGTLRGRRGTFALHHTGVMTRGTPQLTITVVPDSGTGELVGLAGKLGITIADGKHSYDFEYTLPNP